MAWFDNPVTQGYGVNGETGVDIGTPFHTPITLPYGGTVINTTYADYGGLVQIMSNIPGLGNVVQSFVHLDVINVAKGAVLSAGNIIGLSGGENPGYPGGQHPAQPQFSSGPHTEYNLSPTSNIWNGGTINPLSWLRKGSTANTGVGTGSSTQAATTSGSSGSSPCGVRPTDPIGLISWLVCMSTQPGDNASGAIAGAAANDIASTVGAPVAAVLSFVSAGAENVAFFVLALAIIVLGIVLIAYEPAKEGAIAASKAAILA